MDGGSIVKIAMVGLRGVPATHGGVERVVEELGTELVDRGHEVIVFCRSPYYADKPRTYRGMRLVYLPSSTRRGIEAFVHSALASVACLFLRPDVVHVHALGPGLFSPLLRVAARGGVVQTIHGLDDERDKWGGFARRLLRLGGWMSSRVPDEVIVLTRALARHYEQTWARRTTVIPNGVPVLDPGSNSARLVSERFGVRPGGYLLHVGRQVPEKAADALVEAYAQVETDQPLLLVGSSSHSDGYVTRLAELAARDPRVRLVGRVDGEPLAALYAHASGFVLPSRVEGMPLTLLEAAAAGVPVLVSDIEPHLEVLGSSAPGHRTFPVGDRMAMALQLQEMVAGGADERAGAAVLQSRVMSEYQWGDVAKLTEEVYESVRGPRRAPSRRVRHADPLPPYFPATPGSVPEEPTGAELRENTGSRARS